MCHYLSYTSAWVTGDKEKMEGWKDWEAVAAYANTHHANSTVIYWESCQRRGQMTFTHSYQWKISLDRDFFIASLVAPGPSLDSVCMSVCRCASVCCCIKLTLSWASGRRNTLFTCWFHLWVCLACNTMSSCWDNNGQYLLFPLYFTTNEWMIDWMKLTWPSASCHIESLDTFAATTAPQ